METTKTGLEAMCQRPESAWGWPYRVSADGENHYVVDDFGDFARVEKPGRVVLLLRQERRAARFYEELEVIDGIVQELGFPPLTDLQRETYRLARENASTEGPARSIFRPGKASDLLQHLQDCGYRLKDGLAGYSVTALIDDGLDGGAQ